MLPAAVANVVPIVSKKLPLLSRWNTPVDFGLTFRGKPLLGTHKTWRGIITGVVAALIAFWLLKLFAGHWSWVHHIATDGGDYTQLSLWFGVVTGFGALLGDMVKSFWKRQLGIASGHSWVPFDQVDYIIGGVLLSLPFAVLSWSQYVWIFLIWFGMHLLFSYLGYKWGLKDTPI